MLVGAKLEFKTAKDFEITEGTLAEDNDTYQCWIVGEKFTVIFKQYVNDQILVIQPDFDQNIDPDGGITFMTQNIISLVNSLISDHIYM